MDKHTGDSQRPQPDWESQNVVVPTLRLHEFAHRYDRTEYAPDDVIARTYEKVSPAVVQIFDNGKESGSGFFVNKDGKIATAFHCVPLDHKYQVRTADNQMLDVKVTSTSPSKDVAVLQVVNSDRSDFAFLKFRENTGSLKKDDLLIAIGHPHEWPDVYASPGKFNEIAPAASVGFLPINVSGRDDMLPVISGEVHVASGNSGGPIVDKNGEVVGLTSAGNSEHLQAIMAETIRMGLGEKARPHYPSYLPHTLDWGSKANLLTTEALVPTLPLAFGAQRTSKILMGSLGAAELVFQDLMPFVAAMHSGTGAEKFAWSANIAGDTMMIGSVLARRPAVSLAIGLSGIGIKLANQVLDKRRFL